MLVIEILKFANIIDGVDFVIYMVGMSTLSREPFSLGRSNEGTGLA